MENRKTFQKIPMVDGEHVPLLGFLTVIDHQRYGLIGGLLVLNQVGRPVEFHCTAPVRANRAQEILFGNTLQPYLYGEQIAQALIRRAKSDTSLIITDVIPVLAVQDFIEQPTIYVASAAIPEENTILEENPCAFQEKDSSRSPFGNENQFDRFLNREEKNDSDFNVSICLKKKNPEYRNEYLKSAAGLSTTRWKEYILGDSALWIPEDHEVGLPGILECLKRCSRAIDFTEPFSRIRLALEEAQKAA